ncbi:MAG: M48 family metalloprotease [Legionella sp.]|nr:M48 family metalloprotease [Legionella sp.]
MNKYFKRFKLVSSLGFLFTGIIANYSLNDWLKNELDIASKENDPLSVKDKQRIMIIEQAFRDLGFKGPLDVLLKEGLSYRAVTYISPQGCAAVVGAPLDRDYPLSDEDLYAIAGHEAAHVLHNHGLLQQMLILAILSSASGVLSLGALLLLCRPVSQLCEADADITSAIKLNTAKTLIKLMDGEEFRAHNDFNTPLSKNIARFFSTHPLTDTRINYLSPFVTDAPLPLFKSERYHQILEERAQAAPEEKRGLAP